MIDKRKEILIEKYQAIIRAHERILDLTEDNHKRVVADNIIACCQEFIEDLTKL